MNLGPDFFGGIEFFAGGFVLDDFDPAHHSKPSDVTNVWMIFQSLFEVFQQSGSFFPGLGREILFFDQVQHGQRNSTSYGMGTVGVSVHPWGSTVGHCLVNFVADPDSSEGKIPGSDRLGELDHIGFDSPMLESEQGSGSSETGDDFIRHKQDLILIADFTDSREIIILRNDDPAGSLNRLCQEHGDCFRSFPQYGLFQFICRSNSLADSLRSLEAVGIGRRDVDESGDSRFEHRPVTADSGGAHRGQRHPVITPLPRNHLRFLRLAFELPIIPCHLEVAVTRLASAGSEEKMIDFRIHHLRKPLSKFDRFGIRTTRVS